MHLLELIESNCATFPERFAALGPDGDALLYRDLSKLSDSLASQLQKFIVAHADGSRGPVAVIGHKSPKMLAGFLGVWKTGGPYIPLDTFAIPNARIDQIVDQAHAWRVQAENLTAVATRSSLLPDVETAYIIFTSGSTGVPKGVVIPMEAVEHFVDGLDALHDFEAHQTWLNVAPWSFDLSVLETYVSLATAGTIISVSRQQIDDPNELFDYFHAMSTSLDNWVSTPSFADFCLADSSFNDTLLPRLRRFFFCGEVLKAKTAQRLLARFPSARVFNMYGPTEACCAVTSVEITAGMAEREPLPAGRAFGQNVVKIVDPQSSLEARPGERGEVIIMGPQVALGYLDIESDRFFVEDGVRGYRTGDWGRLVDGMLFVEGRMDRQVKISGFRVELSEVELALRRLENVEDAAVTLTTGGHLRAYVIAHHTSSSRLKLALKRSLPFYMIPKTIVVAPSFPLTANGKIDVPQLELEHGR